MSRQDQPKTNGSGSPAPSPVPSLPGVIVGRVFVVSPDGATRAARVWSLDSARIVQAEAVRS